MKNIFCLFFAAMAALSLSAQEPDTLLVQTPDSLFVPGTDSLPDGKVDSLFLTGMEEVVSALKDTVESVTTGAPDESFRDFDGARWWTYDLDGVILSLDVRYVHHYGRYYRIGIHLLNHTSQAIPFDFDAVRMTGDDGNPIRVYSWGDYSRRVRRKQNWRHFGAQIAMVPLYLFAIAVADEVTDFNDDGWHSLGESIAESVAYGVIDSAASIGSGLIAAHYGAEAERIQRDNVGYLHDFRIAPDHDMEGHFFARYSGTAREVTLEIPIGKRVYRIPFLNIGLPEVGKELE